MPDCPRCGSEKVIKTAPSIMENRNFSAKNAAIRLVENPSNKIIPKETWNLADKLLQEKHSLKSGFRDMKTKNMNLFRIRLKMFFKSRLILECDEIWPFV